jgi:hypothetical protein
VRPSGRTPLGVMIERRIKVGGNGSDQHCHTALGRKALEREFKYVYYHHLQRWYISLMADGIVLAVCCLEASRF